MLKLQGIIMAILTMTAQPSWAQWSSATDFIFQSGVSELARVEADGSLDPVKGPRVKNHNATCDASMQGTIRLNDSKLEYCDGTDWVVISGTASTDGYFVISGTTKGDFGGLSGGDAFCLSELQSKDWLGKSSATLSASNVKAWLCDSSTCQNLEPDTKYIFASTSDSSAGGHSFTTDASGFGPGDSASWETATTFGASSSDNIWTGRGGGTATMWDSTTNTNNCSDWSASDSATKGRFGDPPQTDKKRWNNFYAGCNSSYALVCMVNP